MYAFNAFVLVLVALFSFANALPLGHGHIRRSCPHNARASALSAIESASSAASSAESTPLSSTVPSSSSSAVPTATSSKAAASHSASAPSSSASSAKATATRSATNNAVTGSLLGALFPIAQPSTSWTTLQGISGALSLSDSTFNPDHVLSSLTHNYVASPGSDSKLSMQAHYPKGSYTFGHQPQGGISFYAPGPSDVDLTTAKEATFGYSVMFDEGFDWNKGGKLPGLCECLGIIRILGYRCHHSLCDVALLNHHADPLAFFFLRRRR